MLNGGNEHKSTVTLLLLPSSVNVKTCTFLHFSISPSLSPSFRNRKRARECAHVCVSVCDPETFRTYYINARPNIDYNVRFSSFFGDKSVTSHAMQSSSRRRRKLNMLDCNYTQKGGRTRKTE